MRLRKVAALERLCRREVSRMRRAATVALLAASRKVLDTKARFCRMRLLLGGPVKRPRRLSMSKWSDSLLALAA
jgi:hypothetical protein